MIDQLPLSAHQIQIALISQRDIVKHILQACVGHIDQKNSLGRGGSLRNLHGSRDGDNPPVLIFTVVKNILNMRQGKMKVLRMLQGILKPLFFCHVHPVFQPGRRHRRHQLPIPGKQRNIGDRILIVIIEQGNFAVYLLPLRTEIHVFDHSVIQRIRQLHDSPQVSVHRQVNLIDHRLILLPYCGGKLPCDPPVYRYSDQEEHHNSADGKINKYGIADAYPLKKIGFSGFCHIDTCFP